jgi:hypothetical protein
MSDRVGYMVGDTKGRDHQMFPTILRSEILAKLGPDTNSQQDSIWPVDISLAQIMALFWRVRKWSLTGSMSGSCTQDFYSESATATIAATDLFPLKYDPIAGTITAITKEADLLYYAFGPWGGYYGLQFAGIGAPYDPATEIGGITSSWSISGTYSDSGSCQVDLSFPSNLLLFDPVTKLFSLPFKPTGNPGGFGWFTWNSGYARLVSTFSRVGTSGGITIKPMIAPDFDVPMDAIITLLPPVGTDSAAATCAFTLQATEFWAYQNSLGQPVYDTSSGAQINDPFA